MTSPVSVSWLMADVDLILGLKANIAANPETNQLAVDAMGLLKSGQPVPPENYPKKLWGDGRKGAVSSLPDLFDANGYYVVSERAKNVIETFDLGAGALYPVGIYQADQKTPVAGSWYCWAFGNTKQALVAEKSEGLRPFGVSGSIWNMPFPPIRENAVAVNDVALEGPDVWIDPNLFKAVFVSAGLSSALARAGLTKAFRLSGCRLV